MLVFSQLEKKGNLGNQLFQIASVIGMAKKNKMDFAFSDWKASQYFEVQLPKISNKPLIKLREKHFHYHDWEITENQDYDLDGWLQSEQYFDKSITSKYFSFKKDFKEIVKDKFQELFEKKTIAISIRRGDFVGHPDYFQLPVLYYILALNEHFPNWRNCNLLLTSDDIAYCKVHFGFLDNVFFAENCNAIEQLCLGSLCDDFIISNSTFSWWIAYLGEKENSKVIRPAHYFRGKKAEESSDQDYFPARWLKFDHSQKKLSFQNSKFNFVIYPGLKYRPEDLKLIEELLHQDFEATVDIQIESVKITDYQNINNHSKELSFFIHNAYVLPPMLILESLYKADSAKVKEVLFNVQSVELPRNPSFKRLSNAKDIGILEKTNYKSKKLSNCFSIIKTNTGDVNYSFEIKQFKFVNAHVLRFSHSSNFYLGINEMIFKIKFKLYSLKKKYGKPIIFQNDTSRKK